MRSSAPVLLSFLSIALSTGAYYSPLSSRDTPGRLNLDLLERDLLEDPLYARAISTYITGVIVAREAEAEAKAFAKAEAKRDAWAEAQNEAKALSNLEDQFPVPGSSNPKSGTPVSKSGKSSKGKKTYQGRNSREPAGKEPVDNLPVLPLAARSSDAVASSPADQAAQYVQEQQLEHPLTFNQNSSPDGKNSQSQQNTRRSTFPDALEDIENLPPGARSADASSTLERTGPAYGQGTYPATVPGEKQGGKKSKKSSQSQQNTRRSPSPDTFEDIENLRLAARSANAEGQINGQDIPESLLNSPKTTNPSWYQQTSNPNGKSSKGKKSSQPQNRRRSASPSSTNDANPELSARTPYVQTPSSFPGASGSETTQAGKNSPKGKKSLQSQSQKRRRSPPSALDRAKAALGRRKPNVREDKIYPNELQRRAAEALTSAPLVMAGSLGLNQQSGPGPTSGSGSNPGAKSTRNKRGAARKPKPSVSSAEGDAPSTNTDTDDPAKKRRFLRIPDALLDPEGPALLKRRGSEMPDIHLDEVQRRAAETLGVEVRTREADADADAETDPDVDAHASNDLETSREGMPVFQGGGPATGRGRKNTDIGNGNGDGSGNGNPPAKGSAGRG